MPFSESISWRWAQILSQCPDRIKILLNLPRGLDRTKELRDALIPEKGKGIESARLFQKEDVEIVHIFGKAFRPELEDLQNALPTVESSPAPTTGSLGPANDSPSRILFGANDYPEVNRTVVGMLALKWIIRDEYSKFVGEQEASLQLSKRSFQKLRELFLGSLQNENDVYHLLVSTVVNDLGKNPKLPEEMKKYMSGPEYPSNPNHDLVAYVAAKNGCLKLIEEAKHKGYHHLLLVGLKFGSELNIAQIAQAENVPGSLKFVKEEMQGKERSFKMKFLEIILDVAGAYGHIDARSAKPMTEPVFLTYQATQSALLHIIEDEYSLRKAYDEVLEFRAKYLYENTGWQSLLVKDDRALSVANEEERALLRLLAMGRTATKEQAVLFDAAFNELPQTYREALINGLSVDGVDDGVAIVPYYSPALFAETIKRTKGSSRDTKVAALASIMRFLKQIYAGTKPERGTPGEIIERSVAFAQSVVKGEEFLASPNVLDNIPIPELHRRKSH
jgi:hypothetical protein